MTPSELFTVRPDRFVAARNQLVKEMKAAGEREQAAAVAAWRRPSSVDWVLNVTAAEHEDEVASFLDAADAARAAQAAAIEGRPGEDLRTAVSELRDATGKVVRLAEGAFEGEKLPAIQPAAITARLAEVATSQALGTQLRERRLGSGGVERQDLFAGLEPAPVPKPAPSPKRRAKASAEEAAPAERPSQEAVRAAEREAARALAAAERAAIKLERAAADVADAEARLAQAQAARAAAHDEHDRLEEAAEEADRVVERLRSG